MNIYLNRQIHTWIIGIADIQTAITQCLGDFY